MAFAPSPPPRSVVDSKLLPYIAGASDLLAAMTPHEIKDAFRDGVKQGIYRMLTKKPVTAEEEEVDRKTR